MNYYKILIIFVLKLKNNCKIMTVGELIKILEKYPKDSKIFITSLCMGWLNESAIAYNEYDNTINFVKIQR